MIPAGLALHHGGNPAASLRVDNVYCLPVLLSGLASLLLSKAEINKIGRYYKVNIARLMKIPDRTPECAVYFLAGTLPFEAHLHLRQFSLFSMIRRLKENILHELARKSFLGNLSGKVSWFGHILFLCNQYSLPHPLALLDMPISHQEFKKLYKTKVLEYWYSNLNSNAASLSSLRFLRSDFLSLTQPHPIWSSLPGHNPYEVRAARIQALLLVDKYRNEKSIRFWSENPSGFCRLPSCLGSEII